MPSDCACNTGLEAADEIERLRVLQSDALKYAQQLAAVLWEKHWKQDAPAWSPDENLIPVLSQIDNATAGLVRPVTGRSEAAGRTDDAEVMRIWRECGLPEYFLGNGGSNHKLVAFAKACRAALGEAKDE